MTHDYGPVEFAPGTPVFGVKGDQFWDNPIRFPPETGVSSPSDIGVTEIIRNIDLLKSGDAVNVLRVEWCVRKRCGEQAVSIWDDIYKQIAAGEAVYQTPGLHCTSAVCRATEGTKDFTGGAVKPKQFLKALASSSFKHECGENRGKFWSSRLFGK